MRQSAVWVFGLGGLLPLGIVGFELFSGPRRLALGVLELPKGNLQALLTLSCILVASSLLAQKGPSGPTTRAIIAGLLAAAAMLANTRRLGAGDSRPAAYLPFAIARTQSLTFDKIIADNRCLRSDDGALPYWFVPSLGRTVSMYPLTTGLLALPIELPSALGTFELCSGSFNDLEKIAATLLASLGVALMFFTFEELVGLRAAILAGVLYVVATPVLPILGQALWQHTGACLGFALAIFGLFSLPDGSKRTAVIAFGGGLGIACRPVDIFLAVGLLLALVSERRGHRTAWLAGTIPLAGLGVCNWITLGVPWATGYGAVAVNGWTAFWPEGLLGLLVSPARGLLLLYPVLIFATLALIRRDKEPLRTLQYRLLIIAVAVHLAVMAKWWGWTGGYSPAPRMLSDVLPILGVGLALAVHRILTLNSGRFSFVSAAVLSILCASLVTYVYVPLGSPTHEWIWEMSAGPWDWRAYPPVAYWLGALSNN